MGQHKCDCGLCNLCKSRERMRLQRQREPEHVRALDRARYQRDKKKRRAAMDAYAKANPERVGAIKKAWIERNPEKRKAHNALAHALRAGKITRGPCEKCGAVKVHGHHDDYSKPLEVRWLCPIHHAEERKKSHPTSSRS